MMCVEVEGEGTDNDKYGEEDFAHTAGMISDNWWESDASSRRLERIESPFVFANADSMPDKCAAHL